MDKIDTFRIINLTVEGFKCFVKKSSFQFGAVSTITGHNGQGKSSIADAISYAITGSPICGEQGLDRLYALGSKKAMVELTIITGDGQTHCLTRSRMNDVTAITYDGVTVRQSDLIAMFGEKDVFLSIFNPLYFIEVLGDKGRNLLERYLPAVPHEAVLERIGERPCALIENRKMKSPESLLESVRAEIRELDDAVIYAEGQRDLLASQAQSRQESVKSKRAEIDALDLIIDKLEKKRSDGLSFSVMQENLDKLYARCDELTHEGIETPDTARVDAEIQETIAAQEKRRADRYVSQFAGQIAEAGVAIAQLRGRYARETAIHAGLAPGIQCPTCKQGVTEQNIASVKKSFADSIALVTEDGRSLSSKLKELRELDESAESIFEQFRSEDVMKLEAKLVSLRKQRDEIISDATLVADGYRAELDRLKCEIQELEASIRFGNLMPDEGWALEEHREDRKKLVLELESINNQQTASGVEEKAADIDSIKKSISGMRELEEAVKYYISERTKLMLEGLGSLNRADIVLYETVKKTGMVKDVFRFTFDEKPYRFLSLSEKIKAGLEVSELVKRLTLRNYPVFIDNAESVPVIDNIRPSGQIFISQVVKCAPLEISGAQQIPAKAAA